MPQKMTVAQFVHKWGKIELKERSASQSHFNDICALVGHKTPTEIDPTGQFFTFEADVDQDTAGGRGWADAWYKDKFIWEYKGHRKHDKNLYAAYQQRFARVVARDERLRAQSRESARQAEALFQSLLAQSFASDSITFDT